MAFYISEQLDFDMRIFLIIEYAVLPVLLIIFHRTFLKNVSKLETFFLFCCITTWSWIGVFIVLFGTSVYCPSHRSCLFGGIDDFALILALIILSTLSWFMSLLEPLYGWSCDCCYTEAGQPLPIQFDSTPAETVRDIINRIEAAGPSLVAGAVVETDYIRHKNSRTSFWDLISMQQFPYLSWTNEEDYPYFDEKQGYCFSFNDLDEVFMYDKPLVIKTSVDIEPANDQTRLKYETWANETTSEIKLNFGAVSAKTSKKFREELVTDQELRNDHSPSNLIPSAQLPSLVTQLGDRSLSHVMLARDRLLYDRRPCWLSKRLYTLATILLLGPLYRVCYWLSVRVVKLHFRKTFNTENDGVFLRGGERTSHPYINNLEGFTINTFS